MAPSSLKEFKDTQNLLISQWAGRPRQKEKMQPGKGGLGRVFSLKRMEDEGYVKFNINFTVYFHALSPREKLYQIF
jgi:hypothetical protein